MQASNPETGKRKPGRQPGYSPKNKLSAATSPREISAIKTLEEFNRLPIGDIHNPTTHTELIRLCEAQVTGWNGCLSMLRNVQTTGLHRAAAAGQ